MRDIPKKELSKIDGREVYILQDAHKSTKTNGIKAIDGGVEFLAYECTYERGPCGYEGRLYARTIGARRFQQMVRMIANHGLDIRDFDAESEYFNIAAQIVEKLVSDIEES